MDPSIPAARHRVSMRPGCATPMQARHSQSKSNLVQLPSPASHSRPSCTHPKGNKFLSRFDAVSYVKLTESMDTHDVGRARGGVGTCLLFFCFVVCCLFFRGFLFFWPCLPAYCVCRRRRPVWIFPHSLRLLSLCGHHARRLCLVLFCVSHDEPFSLTRLPPLHHVCPPLAVCPSRGAGRAEVAAAGHGHRLGCAVPPARAAGD